MRNVALPNIPFSHYFCQPSTLLSNIFLENDTLFFNLCSVCPHYIHYIIYKILHTNIYNIYVNTHLYIYKYISYAKMAFI